MLKKESMHNLYLHLELSIYHAGLLQFFIIRLLQKYLDTLLLIQNAAACVPTRTKRSYFCHISFSALASDRQCLLSERYLNVFISTFECFKVLYSQAAAHICSTISVWLS